MVECYMDTDDFKHSENHIMMAENSDKDESDAHLLLDRLGLHQINVKQFFDKPKTKCQELQTLLKKRSHLEVSSYRQESTNTSLLERRRMQKSNRAINFSSIIDHNEGNSRLRTMQKVESCSTVHCPSKNFTMETTSLLNKNMSMIQISGFKLQDK
jgi:hypothetical protein